MTTTVLFPQFFGYSFGLWATRASCEIAG